MMPLGFSARMRSAGRSWRTIWQKTFCSRTRRAMSWPYCEPKSKIRMRSVSGVVVIGVGSSYYKGSLTKFHRAAGGRLDRVDQGRPDAAALQGVQAGDGRAAGARD